MSNAALNAVFQHSKSEGLARLIMLSIADRADDRGRAFCGAGDLSRRANADRRNVFRSLKTLRATGELEVMPRKGIGGCNAYRITLDQWHNATSGNTSLGAQKAQSRGNTPPKPNRTQYSAQEVGFSEFWKAYPLKIAKPRAEAAWRKTHKHRPPIADLLEILAKHAAAWNDPNFIPHPATWLNGHRWEDELKPAPSAGRRSSL
jgi:hypothetical protein